LNHNGKSMPSRSPIAALLACVFTLAAAGCGDEDAGNPESAAIDYEKALADAPPKLAALYEQGDAVLPGGLDAYGEQLARLEGTPAVVNVWASWCGPCRFEFPYFQQVAAEQGDEVAFLGVLTDDTEPAARDFLDELPLPYPSIDDPDKEILRDLGGRGPPITAFYDASGELAFVHHGPYASADDLGADIDRYAQ
jgi:cytochrome c biogenesis protein CcmG/thiol:disulfide interchange protein DsbE